MTEAKGPTSPPWQPGTRLVAAVFFLLIIIMLIYSVRQLAAPIVLGLFLAYLLHPLVRLLMKWTRMPHWLTVLILYILVLALFIGTTTGVGLVATEQITGLVEDLIVLADELPQQLGDISTQTFQIGPWTFDLSRINLDPIIEQLTSALQPILLGTGSLLASFAGAAASALGVLLLVMVIGFYLLLDFENLRGYAVALVPSSYEEDINGLLDETGKVWQAFLRGQLLLGVVVGSVVTVVLMILGVRFALGLGIIAGLLEFVPIFGPIFSGVIAGLVAFFQDGNWMGVSPTVYVVIVLGAFLIIQQIENNFLVPRIIGHSLKLNPIIVLLAALAGGILAGVLGVLLAAPTVATMRLWLGYIYSKIVGLGKVPEPIVTEPTPLRRSAVLRRIKGMFEERQADQDVGEEE
jgi:predicted PurR-regulated permease PerM